MQRSRVWYKLLALVLVSLLIVPLLAACGGGKEEQTATPSPTATAPPTPTATPGTPTPTPTLTATPTPTPSQEPVKIGAITSWSGPAAMAGALANDIISLVSDQVNEMGGILGGRPIKVIKYDDRGQVTDTIAGWRKLTLEDKVEAIVWGGATAATTTASYDAAQEFKTLFVGYGPYPSDLTQKPYTVRATYNEWACVEKVTKFILSELKPKTVALFGDEETEIHKHISFIKQRLVDAGVEIVYEQYAPLGGVDLTPYLTKIKYANPDVLVAGHALQENHMITFKQIMELGGWGSIKYVSFSPASGSAPILKMAGAENTYHWVLWAPGLPYPGAKTFEQDFMRKYGRLPGPTHAFFYFSLWIAIKALELAGTDTDLQKIAQMARSGQLQWDSPSGPLVITTDGEPSLKGHMILAGKGGEIIPILTEE